MNDNKNIDFMPEEYSLGGNEIILYQPDSTLSLDVRVENETVWLNQAQMVDLFQSTKQNISLHINNISSCEELNIISDSFSKNDLNNNFTFSSALFAVIVSRLAPSSPGKNHSKIKQNYLFINSSQLLIQRMRITAQFSCQGILDNCRRR